MTLGRQNRFAGPTLPSSSAVQERRRLAEQWRPCTLAPPQQDHTAGMWAAFSSCDAHLAELCVVDLSRSAQGKSVSAVLEERLKPQNMFT
jgi:hypothetical protein